ncbi:MAG TPA: glucose 1-dehydrogenase [Dehalococcoidia bacterium]|nr:glucose 1-dehydrogenase [Dehalococcoidia bacterium]
MILDKYRLDGKVALITGGSRGIGRAIALGFAEAGANVAIASRKLPDLEAVAKEISALGRRSLPVAAHVGHLEDINSLVTTVKGEFGTIDILVNNAGTSPALASVLDVEERLWDSIMNLNLKGVFFLSQAVAKVMKEHSGGTIINIASVDAFRPEVQIGVYAISKSGVLMATKVMARELAQYNIRVNAIAPGNIHTRLGDSRFRAMPEYEQEMISRTPQKRIGEPEEIVGAALYLASDASSFTTGETIIVDGGILLT